MGDFLESMAFMLVLLNPVLVIVYLIIIMLALKAVHAKAACGGAYFG